MPDLTPATLANANSAFANGGATGSLPLVIAKSAIPFIKISSGTMGNNGALSAVTALPRTFSSGAYIYLPAGAIAAGVPVAAAWYWCVFSSTTAGTVYNSTYTSGQPTAGVTTAFATTGPGAFTGDTNALTAVSVTVPAGTMGVNSRIEVDAAWSGNNTAGNKFAKTLFGAAPMLSTLITTAGSIVSTSAAQNRGVLTAQATSFLFSNGSSASQGAVNATDGAENTANAVAVTIGVGCSVATDNDILESYEIRLIP